MAGKISTVTEGRLSIAGLCLAVAMIHVTDQGGFRNLDDPTWLGWAYRLLEVGSVAIALVVLGGLLPGRLIALGVLLIGAGPALGFILTRTTGLPHDSGDVGNWSEPLGIMSLIVEGTLVLVGVTMAMRAASD